MKKYQITEDMEGIKFSHIALMKTDEGYKMWLEINKDDKNIYFVRNKDGVNAWHCNSLPIDDYRILKIKKYEI